MKSKYTLVTLAVTLFILMITTSTFAQSGKDAYKALKKIEAQVTSGVSFNNYSESLSDATLEFNMFQETQDSGKKSVLAEHMKNALTAYQAAKDIWSKQRMAIQERKLQEQYFLYKDELDNYAKSFPILNSEEFRTKSDPKDDRFSKVFRETARDVLWQEASKELKIALKYLTGK